MEEKVFLDTVHGYLEKSDEEPPPILGSWRNLYVLVLGNLLFWIVFFTLFTWTFQ